LPAPVYRARGPPRGLTPPAAPRRTPLQDLISPHFPSIEYEEASFTRGVCAACPSIVVSEEPGAPLALTLRSLLEAPAAVSAEGAPELAPTAASLLENKLPSPHAPPAAAAAARAAPQAAGGRRGGPQPAKAGGGGEGKVAVVGDKIDGSMDCAFGGPRMPYPRPCTRPP
jgi:hypothetical protein